jgi:hypothetical protein
MKEYLAVSGTLTLAGNAHAITGGDVRLLDLQLTTWGARGMLELVVQDDQAAGGGHRDELLADFLAPDLGTIELTISTRHFDSTTAAELPTIQTRGIITERRLRERVYSRQLTEPAVLARYYRVSFADPAQVLWRQHHPYDLFVDQALQDVVDAHKGSSVTLAYDWDLFTAQRPQVFLGLDPAHRASFYDFVCWLVGRYFGAFTFDHRLGSYTIAGAKSTAGTPGVLAADDVEAMESVFPEIPRWAPRVVNSYTEAPVQRPVPNDHGSAGVNRDFLLDTPIQQVVDDRFTLESARPLLPGRELELVLARWPIASILPGDRLDVSTSGGFSAQLLPSTEPWRVFELRLSAEALDLGPEESYSDAATTFRVELTLRLEASSELTVRLPPFAEPRYPQLLEGKILSETGDASQITYQFVQDQTTALDQYRVQVPLFANQIVTTHLEPLYTAGNVYNPLYKGERVLLALTFDQASIVRMLDWRVGAQAEQDPQGHQLVLGKSGESNTTILHQYVDDKPVLQLLRTNQTDTEVLLVEEGRLFLQVKETT